jgi:thioredoxin-related protein
MKKIMVYVFLLLGTLGYAQDWKTNFDEAKKEATEQDKKILLVFSGSDWCAPCIKLDKNVWQSDIFKTESKSKLILLKADFPKKKANLLSAELTESNKKLAEKYNKEGNFPLVVLLDKNGKVISMTGYKNVSADEYLKLLML